MIRRNKSTDGISQPTANRRIDDFASRHEEAEAKQGRKQDFLGGMVGGSTRAGSQSTGFSLGEKPGDGKLGLASVSDPSRRIDNAEEVKQKGSIINKLMFWKKKEKQQAISRPRWKKIAKRASITLALLVVSYIGLVSLKAWTALSNIIDRAGGGSPALNASSELNGEGDGRVNIMLLGIGGSGHTAGNLADTILVVSIDPLANEAGMLSIPRDLYVAIPSHDFGKGEVFFGSSKINAAHTYGEDHKKGGGVTLMEKTLEKTLGIPIHYYVRIDFAGFRQIVDAVGGIDITLDERIYDPIFDREYGSHALDIGPGEVHLNGLQALLLGRARGSTGGIGLSRSDFDRGEHQRAMLIAIKNKALSLGTYANPNTLLKVLDALGGHLRTNLQIGDMLRLKEIGEKIETESILSYGLDTSADNYLTTGNIGGASVLLPRSGNFTQIQSFVRSIFVDGFIRSEKATIDVLNGTTTAGLASSHWDLLKSYGYYMGRAGDAPSKNYKKTMLVNVGGGNKFTQRYLEQRYGVKAVKKADLPEGITTSADFVLILGNDAKEVET